MTDTTTISERIKQSIKDNGGYENISAKTGINSRTLKRIAAGETEPKFKDVISICEATNATIYYFAYGISESLEESLVKELEDKFTTEIDQLKEAFNSFNQSKEETSKMFDLFEKLIENNPDLVLPEIDLKKSK